MASPLIPPNHLSSVERAAPPTHPHHHTLHHVGHPLALTILSQNLYGAEEHEPHRRAQAFAQQLEKLLPDVVGLQEVRRWNLAPLLASDLLRRAYPQLQSANAASDPPWTMVLTRTSPHLQLAGQRHFAGVGGWRGMDVAYANVTGRPVTFASLHLSAFDCPAAAAADEDARPAGATPPHTAKAVDEFVEEERNATSKCPGGETRSKDLKHALDILARDGAHEAVLTGDFNFGTRNDLFREELTELGNHPEWRDAWAEAARRNDTIRCRLCAHASPGYTWDNARNGMNKRDGAGLAAPLNFPTSRMDRVMFRGGVRARSARLANEEPLPPHGASASSSAPSGAHSSLFISDHFGVLVEAELHAMPHHTLRGLLTLRPRVMTVEGAPP